MQREAAGEGWPMRVPREQRRSGHGGPDGKTLTATIYPGHPAYPSVSEVLDGKAAGAAEILYAVAGCCALPASGHAAAPPSNVMNARRPLTRSPRRRAVGETSAYRHRSPWR